MAKHARYYDFNTYLRSVFGCRVQKITIDAGFSCPNRDGTISSGGCIYCNSLGSGTGAYRRGLSVTEQLRAGIQAMSKRYKAKKFIAYFQAYTNTYAPVERLKNIYDEALAVDDVVGISIGTRPDCVNSEILDLLESYTGSFMVWLEYGVQSMLDRTLAAINRGHDAACTERAVAMTRGRGINMCAHVILGLPGETRDDMLYTARRVAEMGFDGIKIHLLYVVKGTRLSEMYFAGDYECLGQKEYVDLVCDVLELLPPGMVIQRITGDPHREELAAPAWSLDKAGTIRAINETLKQRDSFQGMLYNPGDNAMGSMRCEP